MDIRKSIIAALALAALMSAPTVAMASPHHEGDHRGGGDHGRGYRDGRHEGREGYRRGTGTGVAATTTTTPAVIAITATGIPSASSGWT